MKLPDDPKERNQIFVLIGIFGLGALYGLYMGASALFLKPQKEKEKKIASLTQKLDKANSAIDMVPMLQENNDQHIATIKKISDNYILHPQLGNYLIPAEQFIRKHEKASDSIVIEVIEIGISTFPDPKKETPAPGEAPAPKKEWAFKIYTARVEVGGGYHSAVRLAKQLEAANPFLCISSIKITPEEDTPFSHKMFLNVQWPIWNTTKATSQLLEKLDSASEIDFPVTKTTRTAQPAKKAPQEKKKAPEAADNADATLEGLNKLGVKIDEN